MRKRTVTKRRCFCAAKSGRLTLCLLLLAVLLLSLRFGSAAMDWTSFWGGLLRREGFETQSLILYSLRLPRLLQGVLASLRPAVVALIGSAGIAILINAFWESSAQITAWGTNWIMVGIFVISVVLLQKGKMNPILVMVLAGVMKVLTALFIGA